MKTLLPLLILATALTALAEPDLLRPPDGFKWPKPVADLGEEKTIEVATLEPDLRKAIQEIWPDNIPATIRIRAVDLNQDGHNEIFVYMPESSGTGGSAYEILAREEKVYRPIGGVQGSVTLLEPLDGWLQIEGVSRAGGEVYTRYLLRYSGGDYLEVRNEKHDLAKKSVTVSNGSVKK